MAASPPRSYSEFVSIIADVLDRLAIDYAIGGSLASSIYGEPRLTLDVDLAVHLIAAHVVPLTQALDALGIFVDDVAVRERLRDPHPQAFNLIDLNGGWKADCYLLQRTPHARRAFARRREVAYPEVARGSLWLFAPEDVILSKLVYFQQSGGVSTKHPRDIAGMLTNLAAQGERLDNDYLDHWALELGVLSIWKTVRQTGEDQGVNS